MIGLNGGLIGALRSPGVSTAPGVWTQREQALQIAAGTWPLTRDPNFSNVSLLLHMSGVQDSTTFTDSSSSALVPTVNGGAKISTVQSKFGGTSGLFNGSDASLTFAANSAFVFGTGDFTVELWAYQSATPNGSSLISEQYTGSSDTVTFVIGFCNGTVGAATGSQPFLGFFSGTAWTGAAATSGLANSQWNHIAAVRSGTSCNLYVNGTSVASFTSSANVALDDSVYIGRRWDTSGTPAFFNGYIDELRITKGVARYTGAFTPPTLPFANY